MRIFVCTQPLRLPCRDRRGNPVAGREIEIPEGMTFTAAGDGFEPEETVLLEGIGGPRLTVRAQTVQGHFRQLI